MSVLVVGGAGFIGSNIVRKALERGYNVRVLDSMLTGSRNNLAGLKVDLIEGDVRNSETVDKATNNIDYVFHDAAASSSQMFVPDPREGMNINLQGFLNVMHYSWKNEVKKVIYAMSSSAYGNLPVPWKESSFSADTCPNVYAYSLLTRAFFGKLYAKSYGLANMGLIYFSVYGVHEEAKNQYANIISQFIWSLEKNVSPILYGDGNQSRDFIFEDDVAEANLLAAESKASGDIVNVGSGAETSMNEIVQTLNKVMNKKIKSIYAPNPIMGYCYRTLADTSKAEGTIGFKAKYSVEDGIRKLVDYYNSK